MKDIGILLTIHQPNYKILKMFDKIMLLTKGTMVYFGNVDDCIKHFEQQGEIPEKYQNPADFFIERVSLCESKSETLKECKKRINNLIVEFKPDLYCDNDKIINEITKKTFFYNLKC